MANLFYKKVTCQNECTEYIFIVFWICSPCWSGIILKNLSYIWATLNKCYTEFSRMKFKKKHVYSYSHAECTFRVILEIIIQLFWYFILLNNSFINAYFVI